MLHDDLSTSDEALEAEEDGPLEEFLTANGGARGDCRCRQRRKVRRSLMTVEKAASVIEGILVGVGVNQRRSETPI